MFGSLGKAVGSLGKSLSGDGSGYGLFDVVGDAASIVPGIGDSMAANQQNKANIAAADRAMRFSERMSSTAYQRGMADMKAAGLNPMLAFSQGGASAPSGVTPTINSTTKSGLGHAAITAGLGIQSAATAKQQADTQQASAESSIALNKATAAKQVADTARSSAEVDRIRAETSRTRQQTKKDSATVPVYDEATRIIDKLMKSLGSSAKDQKSTSLAPVGDYVKSALKSLNDHSSAGESRSKKDPRVHRALKMDYKIGF